MPAWWRKWRAGFRCCGLPICCTPSDRLAVMGAAGETLCAGAAELGQHRASIRRILPGRYRVGAALDIGSLRRLDNDRRHHAAHHHLQRGTEYRAHARPTGLGPPDRCDRQRQHRQNFGDRPLLSAGRSDPSSSSTISPPNAISESRRWPPLGCLSLDADYELSEALVTELHSLRPDASISGYRARFVYRIYGRPLRGALYPPRTVLYRKDTACYRNEGHGHRVIVAGDIVPLSGVIFHDDRKPLCDLVRFAARYARREAEYLLTSNRKSLRQN